MSRLDFAPKISDIKITDIKGGVGVFTPKPDRPVSFAALKGALKRAGYTLATSEIVVIGKLARAPDGGWWLVTDSSAQRFALEGADLERRLNGAVPGARFEITGDWKTSGEGASAREIITPGAIKNISPAVGEKNSRAAPPHGRAKLPAMVLGNPAMSFAPVRTTSPGLTVYRGGAVVPRLSFIRQRLGQLEVDRQVLQVSASYTPSPRLQLEVEVPYSRTAYTDGVSSGAGQGFGNITLWGKYRFFREVKTYGDRQAAVRGGLELPTGRKSAPGERQLNAPAFVRQQLTPISGGLSPHLDVAFSQAGGRFIYGANVQAILRTERAGFRLGHELNINTDLEYVLLPRDYISPGKELFVLLETKFIHRGRGRVAGAAQPESRSTEYYLAPGLQYAAAPRFVIEGSVQVPLARSTDAQVLRTSSNILLGIRYLF